MVIQLPVRMIIEEASLRVHEKLMQENNNKIFIPAPCIRYMVAIELENQLRKKGAEELDKIFTPLKQFLWVNDCTKTYDELGLKVPKPSSKEKEEGISGNEKIIETVKESVEETLRDYIKLMSIPMKDKPTTEEILEFYYLNAPVIGMELLQAMVTINPPNNEKKEVKKQ